MQEQASSDYCLNLYPYPKQTVQIVNNINPKGICKLSYEESLI